MNKDQKSAVTEFAASLSDDDLRYLTVRLNDRLFGDLPECLNLMSRDRRMDNLLTGANTSVELFSLADQIRDFFIKECRKRNLSLRNGSMAA